MTYTALASQLPAMRRNLRTLYRRYATKADIAQGAAWYPAARSIMTDWSTSYGVSVETAAAVTAALSPQCAWARNLIAADDMLARRAVSVAGPLQANIRKARQLLDDTREYPTLADRMFAYFPYGPKVNSFACNLAGADSVVTIDTHAAQGALNDLHFDVIRGWKQYALFAQAYCDVARSFGLAPCSFQASVWLIWKRLHPAGKKRHARRQWEPIETE